MIILGSFFLLFLQQVFGLNILGLFPYSARSHQAVVQALMKDLVSKGHVVTVLSGIPLAQPLANYTDIDMSHGFNSWRDTVYFNDRHKFTSAWELNENIMKLEAGYCEAMLAHEHIRNLIRSEKTYDVILMETFKMPACFAIAQQLDIPLVWVITTGIEFSTDFILGNSLNPAYVPMLTSACSSQMTFVGRFWNTIEYAVYYWNYHMNERVATSTIQKYMYPAPTMKEVYGRVDLILSNTHSSIFSRPKLPTFIEIGGVHIKEAKPLPVKILQFIEQSEHGVIFFSLGSVLKASSIPRSILKSFRDALSKVPQRVIWRIDDPSVINKSDNIMIGKWFPQRDILEHKNVRIFISHGGQLSTLEAVHTATPVIGIPLLFDQFANILNLQEKGCGVALNMEDISEKVVTDTIQRISDDSYKTNMEYVSNAFKDRPMSAADSANYWINYVVRYNGTQHLSSSARNMPFYQYFLLDVIFFVLIVTILVMIFLYRVILILYSNVIQK